MVESTQALKDSGLVYTWGLDKDKMLCHESDSKTKPAKGTRGKDASVKMLPGKVQKLKGVSSVYSFTNSFMALSQDGLIYGWGVNSRNRIGTSPSSEGNLAPTLISLKAKIVSVSCGSWHTLALSDTGIAFSAGDGKKGELGRSGDSSFAQIAFEGPIEHISAGFQVSFFIADKKVFSCGKSNLSLQSTDVSIPTAVSAFKAIEAKQIDIAPTYAACVAVDGSLWTWGNNQFQQLGLNTKEDLVKQPRKVEFDSSVKVMQVSCSKGEKHSHTHAVTECGNVYSWGDQYKGQLGTLPDGVEWGHGLENQLVGIPQKVKLIRKGEAVKAKKVIAAGIHTAILSTDGILFTFGCGSDGRLGHPEYEGFVYLYKESHPKEVEFFTSQGKRVIDIAASYYQMVAVAI